MPSPVKDFARRLLLRSQTYTGTDNVYIAKHGFWTTAIFTFNSLVSLATVIAFANLVSPEMYGTYKYLLSLIGTLGFLTLSGINTAVAQAVAAGHLGALRYSVRLQLKWNVILLLAGMGLAGWYAWEGNTVFAICLAILSIFTPIGSAFNTYGAYLTGTKEFRRSGIYSAIATIIGGLLNIGAILVSDSIIVWTLAYAMGSALPTIWFYRIIARALPPEPRAEEKPAFLRFTHHLSFVNVLSMLGQYLDKILLFQYVGPAALAIYSFAMVGPERLKGYLKSTASIMVPRLVERSLLEIDRVFYIRLLQSILIGLAAAAAYAVLAPFAFQIFFPQYLDSIRYSQVVGISLAGVMAGNYTGHVFRSHRMLRGIYLSTIGVHSLRIILFVVLGFSYGIWGMIWATLLTHTAGTIWNCILWEWYLRPLRAQR